MMSRPVAWIVAVLAAAVSGYAGWWLYDLGKVHGVRALESLRIEHAQLRSEHAALLRESESLREQVAILDRSSGIDRKAAEDVRDDMGRLQDELQAMREEVEFYRGIVSPGDVRPGLYLHRFVLEPGAARGEYRYDLVLTQLKRNDRDASGVVEWSILGETGGERQELGLQEVTADKRDSLEFRFRYYQRLTGSVILPEGFRAESVRLTVRPGGKKAQEPFERRFEWPGVES